MTIRYLTASITIMLLFLFFIPSVYADSSKTYKVGTDNLNVRSGPSHSAQIIGQFNSNDRVVVFQEAFGWAQTYYDGREAWVASPFLYTVDNQTRNDVQPQNNNLANESLKGYNIVLDPGHGGKDSGAISIDGVYEKNVIMSTVDNVAQRLRDAGATVILTRDSDYFLSLEERVQMSEAYNTDAFISLHYNAYPMFEINGVSTHFYSDGEDRQLASALQSSLVQNISLYSRGINQSNYHILRENSDPAVLVELGFITNPGDRAASQSNAYHNNVAEGIVQGLLNYFSE